MNHTDTIHLARSDALALAELLRTLETVLDMDDASAADALDDHFGFDGAVDILLTAAGLHADALQALLTAPAELSQKTETTR
ncbi:hypothetical protein KGA66_12265 [Actinocrinis puniceicyclus]|uniref:Uncharacterized protein n=1 Tax=Actinocrinis puniceicyclus TaxID=977794 RepID=A0A8J7WK85_9ACTN|nr:hypothetical protein [Actinocrinis puniceicyclus]MBS2963826.1 hypothetical protein [Actinocrinis puniceicyclus]